MWLTPEELRDYEAHAKKVGAMPRDAALQSVHVSLALGASREAALEEIKNVGERVARGDFEVVSDLDGWRPDFPATYAFLRRMGWGRLRAAWKVARKWLAATPPRESGNGG